MIAFYIILAASPLLLLAATAVFGLVVIGLRKGDRRDLASPARNRLDALARRAAGLGTRRNEEEDS